jgi:hypothetical protein
MERKRKKSSPKTKSKRGRVEGNAGGWGRNRGRRFSGPWEEIFFCANGAWAIQKHTVEAQASFRKLNKLCKKVKAAIRKHKISTSRKKVDVNLLMLYIDSPELHHLLPQRLE